MRLQLISGAVLLAITLGGATPLSAQTQTMVIAPVLKACGVTLPRNPATLEVAEAETLVKSVTGGAYNPLHHYVLHVVRFTAGSTVEQEAWYAFHDRRLDSTRLYGAPRVTLVVAFAAAPPALSKVAYSVTITKKRAAPLQNLLDVAKLVLMAAGEAISPTPPSDLCATSTFNVNWRPADMHFVATANVNGQPKELAAMTFDNERKYAVDVSLALPLKTHNDLSFNISDGVATARSVERTDLFAVVNLGLPRDTKRMRFGWPTLLYGMPITGKPLKKHLVAAGFGYSRVQFFAGGLFIRREIARTTVAQGQVDLDVRADEADKWDGTFVWGVNLSVKFVTELFKARN